MTKVNQPSAWPTRKLGTGAVIGPVAAELWRNLMGQIYAPVAGPEMSMLIGTLAAIGVAYWVRDRANVESGK